MPDRFLRLSQALYWTALVLSVLLPLLVLLFAGRAISDPSSLSPLIADLPHQMPVTRLQAGLVALVSLAAVLPMVAALRAMARLFSCYQTGDILSDANAATILSIGRALLLVSLFTVLAPTLQTLILSWNAPQKTLSIGLDGGTLGFAMAAGLLTLIGWAMAEAARIKAENEGFV
jgi:hypothetical protein